jgi:hypothetical protein
VKKPLICFIFGMLIPMLLPPLACGQESWDQPAQEDLQAARAAQTYDEVLDYADLLHLCYDLTRLPLAEDGVKSGQFSSYDRTGWKANRDFGHYLRDSEEEGRVLAEMDGPGCVFRIWSANPSGRLLIYLDGKESPAVDEEFVALFENKVYPFVEPFAYRISGCNLYLPIPYQKSCKIVLKDNAPLYYHIGYKTFRESTRVETFSPVAAAVARRDFEKIANHLRFPGPHLVDFLYPAESLEKIPLEVMIEPGDPQEIFVRQGPGQVALLMLKANSRERYYLRKTLLKLYWDGNDDPAVNCPLGDFFGTPFGEKPFQALPMGMTVEGGYCLFPMPFEQEMRIELENQGVETLSVTGQVVLAPLPVAGAKMRFYAGWRRENPCTRFDYTVLKTQGMGKLVGCALFVDNPHNRWWGEGDEKIWIDGEDFPSYYGTGTEDYFGDAWGVREHARPYQGCTLLENPYFGNKACVYRFHILDSIPFAYAFKMIFENYGEDVDYASVAWWYAESAAGTSIFTETPVAKRLPGKPRVIDAIEAENIEVASQTGRIFRVDDDDLPRELSMGEGVLLKGEGPFFLSLDAPGDNNYVVRLLPAARVHHPAINVKVPKGVSYLPVPIPAGEGRDMDLVEAAWVKMKKGRNEIIVEMDTVAGEEASLVLDAIMLKPLQRVAGVLEAEELTIRNSTGGVYGVEDFTFPWSGGSQVRFVAASSLARIDLEFPVQVQGRYTLKGRCSRTTGYGPFTVELDRKILGEVDPAQLDGMLLGEFEFNAGFLEEGTRLLTLTTDTAVGLDYLTLEWSLGRNHVIEGEALSVLDRGEGKLLFQDMNPRFFSEGKQLWFQAKEEDSFIEVEVPSQYPGQYRLKVFYCTSWDYGKVRLYLNGIPVGSDFDGYNPGMKPSGAVDYGTVNLESGVHRLKFQLVGKNSHSLGYHMGIDALMLVPW